MIEIRLAGVQDCEQMLNIYGPIIENTIISFEYEVPTLEDFTTRLNNTLLNYPWLVCSWNKNIAGYAYAGPHRSRQAYQWSTELSVYVGDAYQRKGIASVLYSSLMAILKLQGYYTALAGISLPNPESVSFHESFGFTAVGTYQQIGYKFGEWHATGWWEKPIQPYSSNPNPPVPLEKVVSKPEFQQMLKQFANQLKARNEQI